MKRVLLLAVFVVLAGCGATGLRLQSPIAKGGRETRIGPAKMTAGEVQGELMTFADTFGEVVNDGWIYVIALNTGRGLEPAAMFEVRRAALTRNLRTIAAAVSIATSPNPVVGLADMITMITLQRLVLESPEMGALYGEEGRTYIVEVYREQERRVWEIGARAMTPEQQAELRGLIAAWHRQHPEETLVANVRLQDFARLREDVPTAGGGSGSLLSVLALDPFAGMDPVERDLQKSRILGERIFFYASRLPPLLRWEGETLVADLLHQPEFRQVLTDFSAAAGAAARVSAVAEDLPEKVAAERRATLDQLGNELSEQREAFFTDLDQRQGELHGTLKELHETVQAGVALADSLTVTINAGHSLADRVLPPPPPPGAAPSGGGHGLADYQAAVAQTSDAVGRMTVLVQEMQSLVPKNPAEIPAACRPRRWASATPRSPWLTTPSAGFSCW